MIRAMSGLGPSFQHITDGGNAVAPLDRDGYQQVLRNSIFVPSPMGNVNLDCFRLYEALELGAIPILEKRLSLDYFRLLFGSHPLPTFRSWSEAAVFVSDLSIRPVAIDDLQGQCIEWWLACKQALRNRIREFLIRSVTAEGPSVSRRYSFPGWQPVELLRHHSLPAFSRRIVLQVDRLRTNGKLRETQGA